MIQRAYAGFIAGLLLIAIGRAEAHPHAWIDLVSAPVFNDAGEITGIEQTWTFDIYYSLFIVEELKAEGGVTQAGLQDVADENMMTLEPFRYFNDVRIGSHSLALGIAEGAVTGIAGERIWMRFTVPLEQPIDPRDDAIRYAIFDPTYFAEMLHVEGEPISLAGGAPSGCDTDLIAPEPTPEAVGLVAALDINATAPDNLGELFAEWIAVDC
ncbi:MAG: DUF1007 family protein [Rhodospirillales bacterium]|nr:DUF1007 family protein [Rhodospirillales bacterium]